MWIGIGFGAAMVVGVGVALLIAARGEVREDPLPWSVNDLARLQASVMAMLGGVSVTGIVIVIGFLSNRAGNPASPELDMLTLMFAVAFGYFVQTAFTLSYLPDRAAVGDPLFRFYYALASTLQFRTILLLVFALTTFGEFFGLAITSIVLTYFVPFSMIGVFIVIAVVTDSLGLMRFGECYAAAAAGIVLAGLFVLGMRWLEADEAYAQLTMAVIFAIVNGMTFVVVGLVPLAPRRPSLQAFLTRNARRIVAVDMQTTIISLIFMWLSVARLV